MATLLYVESSPRKQRSASIEVAGAFLAAYQRRHPQDTIDKLDIWSEPMPEFDGSTIEAKYAGIAGIERTPEQAAAWARLTEIAGRFKRADKILFAVPMWNFTIPYKLKHLLDVISQKDLLFTFDERGLNGLLTGKKAAVIHARGIEYGPESGTPGGHWDLQTPYMELWCNFVGITDVEHVFCDKTLYGPDMDTAARAGAKKQAEALAERF